MSQSVRAPRIWLNPVAVWELLDLLGILQNELARRYGFSPWHVFDVDKREAQPFTPCPGALDVGPGGGRLRPDLHHQAVRDRRPHQCENGGASTDTCPLTTAVALLLSWNMPLSHERILDALARLPFIDAGNCP